MNKIAQIIQNNKRRILKACSAKSLKIHKIVVAYKDGSRDILKLKTAFNISGEWWIDEDGTAMYADGDVGDLNHEVVAAQRITSDFLTAFGIYDEGYLSHFVDEIWENCVDEGYLQEEHREEFFEDPHSSIWAVLTYHDLVSFEDKKQMEIAYNIAWDGESHGYDPRDYAMQYFGWKRMVGNVVQTQTMTTKDLRTIVEGIYDAYGEAVERNPREEFTIEVNATRTLFTGVPFYVMESGSPSSLAEYRNRY